MAETLIVRLPNWLGDTVMAVPTLRALRAARPQARIVAVGPWSGLLAQDTLVDTVVVYPRALGARVRLADTARGLRADVAILLPNSLESALAAWYWGARRRIGFAVGGRSWLLTDRIPLPSPRRHQVDEYLAIVEALGVSADGREPRLEAPKPDSEERRQVRQLLAEARGASGKPLIGVHLGAAYGTAKLWPADRVIDLCVSVRQAGGTPILLGVPTDLVTANQIAGATGASNLVGRDSPELLPALLAELDLLVSGDTGVSHLAAAIGTPAIALFGPTDPVLTAPRGRASVVWHGAPCAPCFYRTCPIDHPCLRSIEASEVMERARALLQWGEGA